MCLFCVSAGGYLPPLPLVSPAQANSAAHVLHDPSSCTPFKLEPLAPATLTSLILNPLCARSKPSVFNRAELLQLKLTFLCFPHLSLSFCEPLSGAFSWIVWWALSGREECKMIYFYLFICKGYWSTCAAAAPRQHPDTDVNVHVAVPGQCADEKIEPYDGKSKLLV